MQKPKVLFVYDHKTPQLWRDGLWAALKILEGEFDIWMENLQEYHSMIVEGGWDFILGWGAINGPVDMELKKPVYRHTKRGLCLAGNVFLPITDDYDVYFYETEWARKWLISNSPYIDSSKLVHAFGINSDIYTPWKEAPIIWDWLSVGAFAYWKRHERMLSKHGNKLVVGEIQKENKLESFDIISNLLLEGVAISDSVYPTKLRNIYNCSGKIYIPADINGGGERAVLEARSCDKEVIVEDDNPKLQELLTSPVWNHVYYADQLKKGILECLS